MQYQSFPDAKGGSASQQKLAALRLPSLSGKRFLDVGCNEGFFCGYALFENASRVVGMDKSVSAINKASARFPDAEFLNQSWDTLPEGPFDVITMLSALHYADDQEALIHQLMLLLADDGLLVLEISMAPGQQNEWVKVTRAIDERWFPTRNKLGSILKDYAWKVIGHSVKQAGDPLQRYVIHIRKLQPYAWLLMQEPGSGKSTIGRRMFNAKPGTKMLSGDSIYQQISQGKLDVSAPLRALITEDFSTATIDATTRKVFEQGYTEALVQVWAKQAGFRDFAIDSYVPAAFQQQVKDALQTLGYFPVNVSWDNKSPLTKAQTSTHKAKQYGQHLKKEQAALAGDRIKITKLVKRDVKDLIKWHLDSPTHGEWHTGEQTLRVAGWALTLGALQTAYQLYISGPDGELKFVPTKLRKDVLESVFGSLDAAPAHWQQQPCGFTCELPMSWLQKGAELGLILNDERTPLARLCIAHVKSGGLGTQLVQNLLRMRGE